MKHEERVIRRYCKIAGLRPSVFTDPFSKIDGWGVEPRQDRVEELLEVKSYPQSPRDHPGPRIDADKVAHMLSLSEVFRAHPIALYAHPELRWCWAICLADHTPFPGRENPLSEEQAKHELRSTDQTKPGIQLFWEQGTWAWKNT